MLYRKAQKKGKGQEKNQKIVRIIRRQQVSFMTVKANQVTNKMASIEHTIYAKNYDVVHITEAGLGKKLPDTIKGYRAIKLDHISPNRGSIMYVKNEYYEKMV